MKKVIFLLLFFGITVLFAQEPILHKYKFHKSELITASNDGILFTTRGVRLKLHPDTPAELAKDVSNPLLDSITFYVITDKEFQHVTMRYHMLTFEEYVKKRK